MGQRWLGYKWWLSEAGKGKASSSSSVMRAEVIDVVEEDVVWLVDRRSSLSSSPCFFQRKICQAEWMKG